MSLHIDERPDGAVALFIDGDLQFDSADEAVYHESMALPPLCLAANDSMRVLICGGGDGLALRECLRFPGVASVDLVDYSAEVVELGRTRFADLNRNALLDARVTVHIRDAWDHLEAAGSYDVVLCDFTVPRRPEDTRVFSREWYARVAAALAPGGVAGLNAVSPQTTPEAFWCLRRTIRTAGLHALPYRVCIPSFRDQGYGAWAFVLASNSPLTLPALKGISCPVETAQADIPQLWRGARFSREERALERRVPVNTLSNSVLMPLLLNPGSLRRGFPAAAEVVPRQDREFDLDPLISAIPILHPYHTREMIETLAGQVAGTVKSLDIRELVRALLKRAKELPGELVRELRRLRSYLNRHAPTLDWLQPWGYRLFAALVITMTLANAIAPDNAFAKGSHGIGHSSFSRGYTGGFAGGRGGGPAVGAVPGGHISGGGFRSSYSHGMTDVYGYSYRPRSYFFYGGYHSNYYYTGHAGSHRPAQPAESHQAVFVADDDTIVLDTGDVILTLSDGAYLLVSGGTVSLMSSQVPDPLVPLYPEPHLFSDLTAELHAQRTKVQQEIRPRRDWLGWVGWTSALFPEILDDKAEIRNMEDLSKRLDKAVAQIGAPASRAATSLAIGPGEVELFVGGILQADGTVAMHQPDDSWLVTDGKSIWKRGQESNKSACAPELTTALRSVMQKLRVEFAADIASDNNDLSRLTSDKQNLNNDLAQYQSIYTTNGSDPNYEVDYGTDEISVSSAISRTERDIGDVDSEYKSTQADKDKTERELTALAAAVERFGK